MTPKNYDGLIASFAAVTGVQTGSARAVCNTGREKLTHRTVNITLVSGTCTWILEGRMNASDTWVQIDTGSASKADVIAHFKEYRFRLSASAGPCTVACRVDMPTMPVQ